ncbi:MAG TPA: NPCBM/NEW2 domain-containing protein [Verrucomicrobiota bacterium]|jgi:hypothetical protein|nr:NPCBM/NEW2 domain-containing protein [Verrucomicrobiota bacterium]HQL80054.1 NPCBM/NEW2 domain-containing protein [Verrucomicrobiota bacterium]
MNRQSPTRRVDMEVAGAEIIEMVVGHGGDHITSDHANWATRGQRRDAIDSLQDALAPLRPGGCGQ